MKPSANCSRAAVGKKWPLYHLLGRRRGIILDGNPASHQDSITTGWLNKWEQTPSGDTISGGAACTCGFRAQPARARGADARSFVIAESRCSPCLRENCPQVSKIKQLNRRKKLAINMVMRMVTFIKLKCKKERRLKNKGWQRNMLFWSFPPGRLEWYLLERQSFHLPQTQRRMWQVDKCTYIAHRWLWPSIQFGPSVSCQKWATVRQWSRSCVSASKEWSGPHTCTHTPGVQMSVSLFLSNGDNSAHCTHL